MKKREREIILEWDESIKWTFEWEGGGHSNLEKEIIKIENIIVVIRF